MKNRKKVVYFVGHYGGFLLCLLHKATYYPENEAFYIYVETYGSAPTNEFMERISETAIEGFGTVICMEESNFWGMNTEEETRNAILRHYDNIFNTNNILLDANTDIYMNFDEFNSMGIYLHFRDPKGIVGIITTTLERLVSYVDMYLFNEIENRHYYAQLQRECRTLDKDGKYVTKVIRTFDIENVDPTCVRKEAYDNAKEYEFFNIAVAKERISKKHKNSLVNLFRYEINKNEKNVFNMLLLSSNFTAFKLSTSMEEFVYGNQVLVDYCLGNRPIMIKPHPRADFGVNIWKEAFANSYYIPSYLPAEYMEGLEIEIDSLLATGSLGASWASKNAKRKINFGRSYWFNYQYIHQLYAILNISSYGNIEDICYWGIPEEMVNSLIECNHQLQVFKRVKKVNKMYEVSNNSMLIILTENTLGKEPNRWMQAELKMLINDRSDINVAFMGINNNFLDVIWNETKINNYFLTYYINKEKIRKHVYTDDVSEQFSIYCMNDLLRQKMKRFSHTYTLRNCGLSLEISCDKRTKLDMNCEKEFLWDTIGGMVSSFDKVYKALNRLTNFWDERLQLIDDFKTYINELKKIDKTIIISVRDTPGHKITPELAKVLQELGINENLHSKHWCSYIAVINRHKVIYEKLSSDMPIYYETNILNSNIVVLSAALKHGNKSKIEINGREFSINGRGLNIVVYDAMQNKLVDSVCFDSHMKGIPCNRNIVKVI